MYKTLNESVYSGNVPSSTFKKVENDFKEHQKLSEQITMFNKLIGKQHRLIGKGAQIFQIDEFTEETEKMYPGMIDWHEYYEEHHTALNIMTETLSKQIMKGSLDQIYNNQEAAKTWYEFKDRADGGVVNLLSSDLADYVKEKYVAKRGVVADVGKVEEVRQFIDNYAGDAVNGLMKMMLFSAYKFKTKVKPDEDRKFDPVFYNKAFKQYQAELLYASEEHIDQDFMQNAHNFMPFEEVLQLQSNGVRSAREAYLFKALINQTQSDASTFAGKLKGSTWEFPADFEAKVFEELQKNHNNPIENTVTGIADKLKILLTQRKWDTWTKFQRKQKEEQAKQTIDAAMKYQEKDKIDKEKEGESWKLNPERIVNKADIIKELTKSRKAAVQERRARLDTARVEKDEQL
jgi:hypothetical protein